MSGVLEVLQERVSRLEADAEVRMRPLTHAQWPQDRVRSSLNEGLGGGEPCCSKRRALEAMWQAFGPEPLEQIVVELRRYWNKRRLGP